MRLQVVKRTSMKGNWLVAGPLLLSELQSIQATGLYPTYLYNYI